LRITEATIAVTNRCNLRCRMCSIWQHRDRDALRPEDFEKLPSTLRHVNICGGEPFLREDLLEVVEVIKSRSRSCRIIIFTHGSLPRIIEKNMEKMSDVGVRVSIDGTEEEQDGIKGVKGSFSRAVETLKRLNAMGLRDLGVKTALLVNQDGSSQIRRFEDEIRARLNFAVRHDFNFDFEERIKNKHQSKLMKTQRQKCIDPCLTSCQPGGWLREFCWEDLVDYIKTKSKSTKCNAGVSSFFMQPNGDIYPCNILKIKMGNIKENTFEEVFLLSEQVQKYVGNCPFECRTLRTLIPSFWSSPLKSLPGSIRNNFKHEPFSDVGATSLKNHLTGSSVSRQERLKVTDFAEKR